jgi:hypothetical protein
MLAMIFSLFSGAAGALGGLLIKRAHTWYNKRYGKKKEA